MPDANAALATVPAWFDDWYSHLSRVGSKMGDRQMEATANLATVLLCGEQSAIHIFAAEIARQRQGNAQAAIHDLQAIEADEHLHEQALRAFCRYLPDTSAQHRHKRRAQRFFAELGRIKDMSSHFARISQLDSAVCRIMWHVEKSALDRMSPLRILAGRIKLDEARHVGVSRHYAAAMGYDRRASAGDSDRIISELIDMLEPLGTDFDEVGVDADELFAHLRSGTLP